MQYSKKQIERSSNSQSNPSTLDSREPTPESWSLSCDPGKLTTAECLAGLSIKTQLLCSRNQLMQVTKYFSAGITSGENCATTPQAASLLWASTVFQSYASHYEMKLLLFGKDTLCAVLPWLQQGFKFPSNMKGLNKHKITNFLRSLVQAPGEKTVKKVRSGCSYL